MNISGISPSVGFYDYNQIKSEDASRYSEIETAEGNHLNGQEPEERELPEAVRKSGIDAGARDYIERYQPDTSYELKGVESDIKTLDVEKAISDMKRDQVLQQYQFFVGESQAEDWLAATREQENFWL